MGMPPAIGIAEKEGWADICCGIDKNFGVHAKAGGEGTGEISCLDA